MIEWIVDYPTVIRFIYQLIGFNLQTVSCFGSTVRKVKGRSIFRTRIHIFQSEKFAASYEAPEAHWSLLFIHVKDVWKISAESLWKKNWLSKTYDIHFRKSEIVNFVHWSETSSAASLHEFWLILQICGFFWQLKNRYELIFISWKNTESPLQQFAINVSNMVA